VVKEGKILKEFILEFTKKRGRLFRCNSGTGWIGNSVRIDKSRTVRVHPGDVIIKQARIFHGAIKGTPDLIGFTQVYIKPEMVGRIMAIYTGVEVKTPKLRPTKEQLNFIAMVKEFGGIGLVAKKFDDVLEAIESFKRS